MWSAQAGSDHMGQLLKVRLVGVGSHPTTTLNHGSWFFQLRKEQPKREKKSDFECWCFNISFAHLFSLTLRSPASTKFITSTTLCTPTPTSAPKFCFKFKKKLKFSQQNFHSCWGRNYKIFFNISIFWWEMKNTHLVIEMNFCWIELYKIGEIWKELTKTTQNHADRL
jgi:hypothetical protein